MYSQREATGEAQEQERSWDQASSGAWRLARLCVLVVRDCCRSKGRERRLQSVRDSRYKLGECCLATYALVQAVGVEKDGRKSR
jgi:hypothetical protein